MIRHTTERQNLELKCDKVEVDLRTRLATAGGRAIHYRIMDWEVLGNGDRMRKEPSRMGWCWGATRAPTSKATALSLCSSDVVTSLAKGKLKSLGASALEAMAEAIPSAISFQGCPL